MKIATQFDKEIVAASGINTRLYTQAEITDYATKIVGHPKVQARAAEILTRSVAAQAIAEILGNPATAQAERKSLHTTIVKECGAAPPVLNPEIEQ